MIISGSASAGKIAAILGLQNGTPAEQALRRSLLIIAAVTIVTAWFSLTFFHNDEHYQVLEWMSYKLGHTFPAEMPWEFRSRVRSWMQPFLYYLIARPLIWAGLTDLFIVVFVLRLVTGLLSLAALALFARAMLADFRSDEEKLFFVRALPFFGYLPYLFVRTSSETLSAAFFTLGLALVVRDTRSLSWARFFCAGLLCGLAFESRYQSALLILPLFLWLVVIARARISALAAFVAANIAMVALALPVDRWGYGVWTFPPWNYFNVNILQNVAAGQFGARPFYSYFYLLPANIFLPLGAVLMLSLVIACIRNPRHVVSWVTLPFFLVHCAIAHKEERFLFPLSILATSYPVLAFAPSRDRWFPFFARLWPYRRSFPVKLVAALSAAAMLFLAVYPYGYVAHLKMARYLYHHFPSGLTAYRFDQYPYESYPFYRRRPLTSTRLFDAGQLAALLAKGPVYLFSETPTLPAQVLPQGAHAVMLYSEMPFAQDVSVAAFGTNFIHAYRGADRKFPGLRLPHMEWMTLFLVTKS